MHSACLSNWIFTYIWITEILTFSVLGYAVTNEAKNSYVNAWLRAHFNAKKSSTYVILTIIMRSPNSVSMFINSDYMDHLLNVITW